MRVFALLLGAVVYVQSACYLMDMGNTCSVCWKKVFNPDGTSNTGGAAKCPDGIKLEWVKELPELMLEGEMYPTQYKFTVNSSLFQYVPVPVKKDKPLKRDVPHANIHSCIAKNGQCVPFISNTPGLATHTTALNGDFDKNDQVIFTSEVTLTKDVYTVIAHGRFKMKNEKNSSLGLTQYDVAIGIKREVTMPQAELSADSMITSGVAATLMIIFIGSFVVAAKKGAINAEAWLMILTGEIVILVINVVLGIGDVSAFSISLYTLAMNPNDNPEAYQAVPIAIVFASVAWIVSFMKLYHDIKQVYLIRAFSSGQDADLMSDHVGKVYIENSDLKSLKSSDRKTFSRQLSRKIVDGKLHENEEKLAAIRLLAASQRAVSRKWYALLAIVTEAIPISGITIYIMLNVNEIAIVNVLCLLFSALVLGANAAGLTQFARLKKNRDDAVKAFSSQFGVAENIKNINSKDPTKVHPVSQPV